MFVKNTHFFSDNSVQGVVRNLKFGTIKLKFEFYRLAFVF